MFVPVFVWLAVIVVKELSYGVFEFFKYKSVPVIQQPRPQGFVFIYNKLSMATTSKLCDCLCFIAGVRTTWSSIGFYAMLSGTRGGPQMPRDW